MALTTDWNAYQREWRRKNRDKWREIKRKSRAKNPESHREYNAQWKIDNPGKRQAHSAVEHAIKKGKMEREECGGCGAPNAQAHHEDYNYPLNVIWLCAPCHAKEHGWDT